MRRVSQSACRGLVSAGLIALACALGPGVRAQSLGPLVQITTGDLFRSCTADEVTAQEAAYGSIFYPNTAIEPWVAIDPTNPDRLLVGYQQDRWNNGGSRGLVGSVSTDGGQTWSNTIPTGVSKCTGGTFVRASDPWVTFAPDGTAFFLSQAGSIVQATTGLGARVSGTLVSRSSDHGQTWSAPTTLITSYGPLLFNDKTSITADPAPKGARGGGFVYAVWDQLRLFPQPGDTSADALLANNEGVVIARELLRTASAGGATVLKFAFTGPTFFSQTRDNGATWTEAAPIYQPGINAQTLNNIVQVLPNGDVLDFFTNLDFSASRPTVRIGYVRSTDKGATWSGPTFVTDVQVVGVVSPDSQERVRDASDLFGVAVDPVSGRLYLAWQDCRFGPSCNLATGIGVDSIALIQSLDGGVSWSAPVKINQTPSNANQLREQAFIPAVAVTSNGTVVVTYYDFRNDTGSPGVEATDYFAVFCHAGFDCSQRASWGSELRLTPSSFNILNAPVASGHFLGDYMGLAASGQTVRPVFGIATGPNLTAAFTRLITVR
jgi:hypothetical protein